MDTEQVNRIVEQVISALGQQGAGAIATAAPRKTLKPTGSSPSALETRPQAKVFITAEALRQRLTGSKGGVIELAANEFLTPSAADLADTKNLIVAKTERKAVKSASRKAERTAERKKDASQAPNTATVGLVIERAGAKTDSVLNSLACSGIKFSRFDESSCWMENLRSMCRNVASGTLAGGVAVMPYAADAMVLANKINGIRAVQGTRIESVKAGLRRFGANVLILEHAVSTFHEMCTMIRVFTNSRGDRAASGLLLEAIGREETT